MSGELGQREWKVLNFREGEVEDNPKGGGQLQKFYVDFEGCPDVYWRRKLPATIEKGNSYFGTISEGTYGPIFKKESPGHAEASAGTKQREWKPESQYDPEKTARIGRAHAQHMSILTLSAMGGFENKSAADLYRQIQDWTSFYEQDVNEAGQAASQGAGAARTLDAQGTAPATASAPDKQPADNTHEWFCKLLEDAALDSTGARAIAEFIVEKFSAEQRDRAEAGLRDIETQQDTLSRLRIAYEKATGSVVPVPSDESVPF